MADPEQREWSFRSNQPKVSDDNRARELGGSFAQLFKSCKGYTSVCEAFEPG